MTDEEEQKREELLAFLLAWDAAEQVVPRSSKEPPADDPDPVVRALQFFPVITLH
jgi:hypothetical protein